MALPDFVTTNNGNEADSLFDAAGQEYIKAAGRVITVGTSPVDSAPHLVEDATLLAGHGSKAVAAGPTATAIGSTTAALRLTLKAWVTNSNTLYVGGATVTADTNATTGGFQLSPGESVTFGIEDIADVFIHGTAGEGASFFYET